MVGSGGDVAASCDAAAPPKSTVAVPPKNNKRRGGGGNNNSSSNGGGTWSPRGCLLVRDFLVPCLDSGCYGDDLQWMDRSRGVFLIRWTHQGSKSFDREGPNVFRDWSILKRKWDEHDPNRLSKAKQRVRAAFRKLPNVRRLNEGTAPHRIYRIRDIGVYLNPWKEPKEKKPKKKRQPPCGCGDLDCVYCFRNPRGRDKQEQGSMSSATAEENDDDDHMDDWEEDCKKGSFKSGVSSPSLSYVRPDSSYWSTMDSLTEPEEKPDESPPPPCSSPPPSSLSSDLPLSHADMEAAEVLLSIRNGCLLQVPALAPPTMPGQLAATSRPTSGKDQLAVSTELRVTSNGVVASPANEEASLPPLSAHLFKELLAAASAPRPAQLETVTGDSPHMFLADTAPARHGEQQQPQQLAATLAEGPFLPDFGVKSEPVASYEAGESAGAAAMAVCTAATHSGGWTDRSSAYSSASSSWRDRNEPVRPDGCWTTR